jgi:sulfatase maturation enzyme AslB (radical SAM superfamily)
VKNKQNVCSKLWSDVNIDLCKPKIRHCCKQTAYKTSIDELKSLGPKFFEEYQLNVENKKKMLFEKELPDSCYFCKSAGNNSIMNVWNYWTDEFINDRRDYLLAETHTNYIEFDIGNSCNMSCVYCGPWSSTTWIKELSIPQKSNVINYEWKAEVFKHLKEWLKTFDTTSKLTFNLLGGEPLMLTDTYDIVEELADMCKGFKTKPVLMLTTNLNLKKSLIDRLLKTIAVTKDIFEWTIAVSIEDTGQRAEYVRYHLDWELFDNNLKTIKKHVDSIYLTTTFTLFSLPNFIEFIDWSFTTLGHNEYLKTWRYSLNNVQDGYSDVAYLLPEQDNTSEIISYYTDMLKEYNIEWDRYSDEFVTHIKNMSNRIGTKDHTAEFFKFWKDIGTRRGIDYSTLNSLAFIIDKKGNST